jgi:hypothetical protein
MTHDTAPVTPRAAWIVTNAVINSAAPSIPCVVEQDYFDEDGEDLDHLVRVGKSRRYIEPARLFSSEAAANEFIADQIQHRLRALTRAYARKTRTLRSTELTYSAQKKALRALARIADMRVCDPSATPVHAPRSDNPFPQLVNATAIVAMAA